MDTLLDTGCLAGDFVARRIVDRFNIRPVINSAAKLSVCSGLDNTCYDISKSVIISVNYINERLNNISTFEIKAFDSKSGRKSSKDAKLRSGEWFT